MPRCRAAAVSEWLQNDGSRFAEESLFCPTFLTDLLYQMVTLQAKHLLACRGIATQIETASHVLNGEFLGQSAESLVGLLATLHVDGGVACLIVEILLSHRSKVVTSIATFSHA